MDTQPGPESTDSASRKIGRRDALKKGAIGAGVVGVVWAAPVIEGLAVTPAYGAVASAGVTHCAGTFDFTQPLSNTIHNADAEPASGTSDFASPACAAVTHTTEDWSVSGSAWGGRLTVTITKNNPTCQFNHADFQVPISDFGHQVFGANNAYQVGDTVVTADKITAQFVSDLNLEGDLGEPKPGGNAHIKITCI